MNTEIARDEIHFRSIDMKGFRRSDGLFEVEGRVIDRKPYDFEAIAGRKVPAHEPIHDMGVRLIFDAELLVHGVETFTDASPYTQCPEGGRALQLLKGLRMSAGWGKEVRRLLGGPRSCTHLMELLIPMASTAVQSLSLVARTRPEATDATGRPRKIDSCYAYGAERELVLRRWPQFHRPSEKQIDSPDS